MNERETGVPPFYDTAMKCTFAFLPRAVLCWHNGIKNSLRLGVS